MKVKLEVWTRSAVYGSELTKELKSKLHYLEKNPRSRTIQVDNKNKAWN